MNQSETTAVARLEDEAIAEAVEQRIKAIRYRERAATPGPWSECGEELGGCPCATVGDAHGPIAEVTRGEWGDSYPAIRLRENEGMSGSVAEAYIEMLPYGSVPSEVAHANAAFIAHSREDVSWLLSLVEFGNGVAPGSSSERTRSGRRR